MIVVRGCIDRINNEKMVIIVETLEREFIVDYDDYDGLVVGDWVVLTLGRDEDIINIRLDIKTTEKKRKEIKNLKNSLKRQ